MENWIVRGDQAEQIELPSGFRFHPTDEELITYYLLPKTLDLGFVSLAIGEADLRKLEPWELPWVAKMGEEEWYLFCVRENRYPTGQRTNRGTKAGYWKATGKDKEIYSGKFLVGMRKTLVFYQGRAPKGLKSNWVMHEYRLDGKYSKDNLPQSAQSDWVISRVFHKNQSGKKTHISALPAPNSQPGDFNSLPPLTDYSGFDTKPLYANSSLPENRRDSNNQPPIFTPSYSSYLPDHLRFSDSFSNNDNSILGHLIDDSGDGNDLLASLKEEPSEDTWPGGGGGGYIGGHLLDDHDLIDTNSFLNY